MPRMPGTCTPAGPRKQGIELPGNQGARRFAIEFEGPSQDTDIFEITIPSGYVVDDLPPPADMDFSFGSYHSKTEVNGPTKGRS
jgi:hypothetical protein